MQFERQKSQFYPYRYGFTGKYFDICIFSSDTVLLSFSILFFIYFILVVARPRCSHPRTSNKMEVILLFAVIISISRASEHENSQENEEYLMVDSGRRSSKDMKDIFYARVGHQNSGMKYFYSLPRLLQKQNTSSSDWSWNKG